MLLLVACSDGAKVVLETAADTASDSAGESGGETTGDSSEDSGDESGGESGGDNGGDPVTISGLTAEVDDDIGALVWASWTQSGAADGHVAFRFEGEDWLTTPSKSFAAGPQRQLVAGAPYGSTVELRVVLDDGTASDAVAIDNDDLPRDFPDADVVASDPSGWDPGSPYVFLSLADNSFGSVNFILDRQGRVVWALESGRSRVALHSRVSLDGSDLLIDENSYWAIYDDGEAATILRMKLDGTVVETLDVPNCHHPFTDLPDGSIVYTAMNGRGETIRRRWPDGSFTEIWDCQTLLEEQGGRGYCGSNTLWYNEATGTVLNSIYSQETIVEVDLEAGTHLRWFGHVNGGWSFDPPESIFWWQHGGYLTADGTLLTSSKGEDEDEETVIREYRLDEETETLVEVWSFGEGEGIYGDVMGEAHRLGNGNTLHNYGSATRLREVTPGGDVVWDVDWDASTMGRSTPIADLYAFVE